MLFVGSAEVRYRGAEALASGGMANQNQNLAYKFMRLTAPQLAIQHPLLTQV